MSAMALMVRMAQTVKTVPMDRMVQTAWTAPMVWTDRTGQIF